MALLPPVPGAVQTQGFGPSHLSVEPSMWVQSQKAYWQPFAGSWFVMDMHAALDLADAPGTPIIASEAGTVVFAGWRDNGGGICVQVEIRDGVRYEHSHCQQLDVRTGAKVKRGQQLARMGSTGFATGSHTHFTVSIKTIESGIVRTFLWDPRLFLPGGQLADDSRIKPLVPPARYVRVNGPGINIRNRPDLDSEKAVYATSRDDGIYRRVDGQKHWELNKRMLFDGWNTNEWGTWARVRLGGQIRRVKKELVHFV
jgi:hypothetical protein